MKQIIQSYKTGEMKLEEIPRSQASTGMVLVENKASLVSAGTEKMLVDLAKKSLIGKARSRPDLVKKVIEKARTEGISNTITKVRSKLDNPIPLGYSSAGIVREVGSSVDEFQVGDRVACGGAGYANHAEFNAVPKNLCVKLPDFNGEQLSFEEASFGTVGAIALQSVRQARLTLGENVCVIGLGLIGQITVQLCKANGCRVIGADIDENKLGLARQLGADKALRSDALESAVLNFTSGVGADAVIITAAANGSQLVEVASEISRPKGRVVVVGFVGLDLPREVFYKKELDLKMSMSYGPGRYDAEYEERGHDYPLPYVRWTEKRNMQTILEMCASGRLNVEPLITHRFPFDKALEAYEMLSNGKEPYLGVLLEYDSSESQEVIHLSRKKNADSNETVKIGVIGAGNFAKNVLLPRIAKNADAALIGVATGRGMTAKVVGEQFGFKYCADTGARIIEDKDINTVLVVTRHDSHAEYVIKCLEVGKHVFVEKPLCITIPQLKEITELLAQSNKLKAQSNKTGNDKAPNDQDESANQQVNQLPNQPILMVGFNRRFSPFIQKAAKILKRRSGPIFACYNVNAGFIPKDSWIQDPNEGGGRIIGEVCHFIATMRCLARSRVKVVYAACIQTENRSQVNRDSLAITLKYNNGSVGTILYHALGSSNYPKERIEIAADGTTIVIDDFRRMDIFGSKKEHLKIKQDKGFDVEIDAFVNSICNGGGPPASVAEIIETTLVTFAVHESLNTGTSVEMSGFAAKHNLPEIR